MKNKVTTGSLAAFGMLLLILDAKTALQGAAEGLRLCVMTIIPAMFPFFILSILLTSSLTGIPASVLKPIGKLCGIPSGSEILLLTGFLGGYPVGAQGVAQAWQHGQLTKQDAQRMLGFCSNAGPAFLFGIIGTQFGDYRAPWILWGIHVFSALLVAMLLPGKSKADVALRRTATITLPAAMEQSLKITAGVCGWIILFRVMIAFFDRWFLWLVPEAVRILLCGILELANGCCQLQKIEDITTRFFVCSGMLSFGGLCVTMQTVTATKGLGLGFYLPGKLVQSIFSIAIAAVLCPILFEGDISLYPSVIWAFLLAGLLCATAFFLQKKKKVVAFQG